MNQFPHAGELWSTKEEALLLEGFNLGIELNDLSLRLGRTQAAILTRLVQLKKLVFNSATLEYYRTVVWYKVGR